jgi:hypothetical protein
MATEINNDCISLNFPSDFTKKQTRVQYLYSMGAMRPYGGDDEWYESTSTISKRYRGIDVKFKVLKNTDGSHRSYKIVEVGDGIRTEHNQIPQEDEVRSVIDNHYKEFENLMGGVVLINEQEFTKMFIDRSVKMHRIYEEDEPAEYRLLFTASKWMLSKMFNRIDKKKILKYLINEGLSMEYAIDYFSKIY